MRYGKISENYGTPMKVHKKSKKKKAYINKIESTPEGEAELESIMKKLNRETNISRERSKNFIPQPLKRIVRP